MSRSRPAFFSSRERHNGRFAWRRRRRKAPFGYQAELSVYILKGCFGHTLPGALFSGLVINW